jgi:hypothetical protein
MFTRRKLLGEQLAGAKSFAARLDSLIGMGKQIVADLA